MNGGEMLLVMMVAVVLIIIFSRFREWYSAYLQLKEKYGNDDIVVKVEDLIPLKFKTYDFRIGNLFFTITKVSAKTLDNDLANGLGIVKIKKGDSSAE